MIYFAFVYPLLLYGTEVYANTPANHLTKLRTLNIKILCILQQKPIRTHTAELYRTYNTLPIQLLHNYQILPPAFSAYFDENKLIHQYNTRQKDDFHTYTVQSELEKGVLILKVVHYGITCQWILKKYSHVVLSN